MPQQTEVFAGSRRALVARLTTVAIVAASAGRIFAASPAPSAEAEARAIVTELVACGTRHSLSSWSDPKRGIGCGRDVVVRRFGEIASASSAGRLTVVVDRFETSGPRTRGAKVPMENVYAIFRGSDPVLAKRAFISSGHLDSMPSDVMDAASDAPGADDDASGVAVSLLSARELARPDAKYRSTLIFAAVSGEEQGLLGARRMKEWLAEQGYEVGGMLTHDIVGATNGSLDRRPRVFSEGGPDGVDSPSRELARRYDELVGKDSIRLIFRRDRFGRGGDHMPFVEAGLPAIRVTEPLEDYRHQHQTPRVENGVQFGDLVEFLDFPLIAQTAALCSRLLAELADAPAPPSGAVLAGAVTPSARIRIEAAADPERAAFEILRRETTDPRWTLLKTVPAEGETVLTGIGTDNDHFAVRAVGRNGKKSLAVAAIAAPRPPVGSLLSAQLDEQRKEFTKVRQEARTAAQAQDFATSLAKTKRAHELRPEHPGTRYNLALAHAMSDDAEGALTALERLLDLEVLPGSLDNPAFAKLRESPRFAQLKRRAEALSAVVGGAPRAFTLVERDLAPEGIAHDPRTGSFFLSSIHKRKIVERRKNGTVVDFAAEAQDGLDAVLALKVDALRRRLWACSNAIPEMKGFDKDREGLATLFVFDLETRKLRERFLFPKAGAPHNCNDMALSSAGDVYVADATGGGLYVVKTTKPKGEPWSLETLLAPGTFVSPNGLAFSRDERKLFVADYAEGISTVDLTSQAVKRLPAPSNASLLGIDGLVEHKGLLIAIQNGIAPARVARFKLNADETAIEKTEILERRHPDFDEPTLGVVVGDELYFVANSPWPHFDKNGALGADVKEPVVLRRKL